MNTNPNTICVNIENKNPCLLTNWPLTIWHDGLPYAVHIDLPAESTITHCFEPYDGKQWTCHECGSLLRYDRSTFVDELGDASVVPASVFICENPACRMYYDVAWNGTSHEPVYLIEQEGA